MLREKRKDAGHTQESLAELLDVHQTYVSQVERGVQSPSWRYLVAFANAIGANIVTLLREAGLIDPCTYSKEQEIAALLSERPDLAEALDLLRDYPHRVEEVIEFIRFRTREDRGEVAREPRPRTASADAR